MRLEDWNEEQISKYRKSWQSLNTPVKVSKFSQDFVWPESKKTIRIDTSKDNSSLSPQESQSDKPGDASITTPTGDDDSTSGDLPHPTEIDRASQERIAATVVFDETLNEEKFEVPLEETARFNLPDESEIPLKVLAKFNPPDEDELSAEDIAALHDWSSNTDRNVSTLNFGKSKAVILRNRLATLLSTQEGNPTDTRLLKYLEGEENRNKQYRTNLIPKKRGGFRELAIPRKNLKWVQRSLLQVFTHLFPRHRCAHGFERGKSVVTHAKLHANRRYVLCLDLKDFFPSISWARVYGMLQGYPFKALPEVARIITNLVTYEGHLPQGAPTSPILANLVCRRLDSRLFIWARTNGYLYSRYADDLAISTNRGPIPEEHILLIEKIIEEEGFEVHPDKKRMMPWHGRQIVTGLIVNKKPNLPRNYLRNLRALIHNIERYGWVSQLNRRPLFFDNDSLKSYYDRKTEKEKRVAWKKNQKEDFMLLSSSSKIRMHPEMPQRQQILRLHQVIHGRITLVGTVRGKEDGLYLHLLERFEAIQSGFRDALGITKAVQKATKAYMPKSTPELDRPVEERLYSQLKKLETSLENGEIIEAEFRDSLRSWSNHSIEFGWLLDKNLDIDRLKKGARLRAFRVDLHPQDTAKFFREFSEDRSFRGLLHEGEMTDGKMSLIEDDDCISISDLIGNCRSAVRKWPLPNRLKTITDELLNDCTAWVEKHQGEHPWNDDEFRKRLLEYKRLTRFDSGDSQTDLPALLKETADSLSKRHNKKIHLPEFGEHLYTYTDGVLPAIKTLLRVMAQHSFVEDIFLEMTRLDEPESVPEVVIRIYDDAGYMKCTDSLKEDAPLLKNILKGESQRALSALRGYARWTLTAPFEGIGSFQYDVMRNKCEPLDNAAAGVEHRLTFFQ